MPAFEKVPSNMRERLAALTNGTRMLGGSADTLYIPDQYRSDFLNILGLFLETNCFLEIAVPTTVHLIVPPDEPIQYVDHVMFLSSLYVNLLLTKILVVDLETAFQRVFRTTDLGEGYGSGYLPYIPLGR